jgi:hypothetical protein
MRTTKRRRKKKGSGRTIHKKGGRLAKGRFPNQHFRLIDQKGLWYMYLWRSVEEAASSSEGTVLIHGAGPPLPYGVQDGRHKLGKYKQHKVRLVNVLGKVILQCTQLLDVQSLGTAVFLVVGCNHILFTDLTAQMIPISSIGLQPLLCQWYFLSRTRQVFYRSILT